MPEPKKKAGRKKSRGKDAESEDQFWMNPLRIMQLSDGVIAIAITILAIKLIPLVQASKGDLWAIWEDLYQYAIGFLSLGIYWILHHHIFHIVKRADGVLVWLNLAFLGFVSLGPFWTALITKNPGNAQVTGLLAVFSCLTFITLLFILEYATHNNRLVYKNLDIQVSTGIKFTIIIGVLIIAIGALVGRSNVGIFGLFSIASAVWFVYMTSHGYKQYYQDLKSFKVTEAEEELKYLKEIEHELGSYWIEPHRISALTDGVIAIAITLMVLELSIPNLAEHPDGLREMGMELFLIGVGFLALGLYWAFHHLIFNFIRRADGVLMWLNILFLGLASLVPFWVAFINITEGASEAMFYYGLAMTFTFISLILIWIYSTSGHRLVSSNLSKRVTTGFTRFLEFTILITIIIFLGNFLIPVFMNFSWIISLGLFIYLTTVGYKRFIS